MVRKCLNWLLNAAFVLIIVVTLAPVILSAMAFILLLILIKTDALDGLSRSEAAIAALEATRLSAYTEHAPNYCMTIDDCMTLFNIVEYDNHVDNTDLRAGLMALAAETEGWHVEAVTPEDYTARIPVEASFLLPDIIFDAWFESAESIAFFDQESGLFIQLRDDKAPKPGAIRADKLTVPHDGYVYTMETHGGFHGDGTTFHALIIPEETRAAFEAALSNHADWHERMVTPAEYAELLSCFYECPKMLPPDDLIFDRWCYVDTYACSHPDEEPAFDIHPGFPAIMREAGARWSFNWLVALYDSDTGLFIFYQYDS